MPASLQPANFTVSFWGKSGTAGNDASTVYTTAERPFLLTIENDGSLTGVIKNSCDEYSAAGIFQNNQWVHAVLTYDGQQLKMYLNGSLVANRSCGGLAIDYTSGPEMLISGGKGSDDVRIYNRALSATEVQQLYKIGSVRRGVPTPPSFLRASSATGRSTAPRLIGIPIPPPTSPATATPECSLEFSTAGPRGACRQLRHRRLVR
jgi:hypothetical protein